MWFALAVAQRPQHQEGQFRLFDLDHFFEIKPAF
jgi:hypothetical protein